MLIVGIRAIIGIAYYMKKKRKVVSADAVIPTTETKETETTIIKTEKITIVHQKKFWQSQDIQKRRWIS